MAACETDSGVTTNVTTAVSGSGYSSESDAKNAKLDALTPQIEADRASKGKSCGDRTCEGTKDCKLAFLIQSERDAHIYSYSSQNGTRWGYDVPAGAPYTSGCKCVPRPAMKKGGKKGAKKGGTVRKPARKPRKR